MKTIQQNLAEMKERAAGKFPLKPEDAERLIRALEHAINQRNSTGSALIGNWVERKDAEIAAILNGEEI